MRVDTDHGSYEECYIVIGKYCVTGGLAAKIMNERYETIATLTVCLPDEGELKENEAFVDINNNPWGLKFIYEHGLGKYAGREGFSGYCPYPLFAFDMEKLKEYTREVGEHEHGRSEKIGGEYDIFGRCL